MPRIRENVGTDMLDVSGGQHSTCGTATRLSKLTLGPGEEFVLDETNAFPVHDLVTQHARLLGANQFLRTMQLTIFQPICVHYLNASTIYLSNMSSRHNHRDSNHPDLLRDCPNSQR